MESQDLKKIDDCIDAWKRCNYHSCFIIKTCLLEISTTATEKKIHVNIKFSKANEFDVVSEVYESEVANQIMEIVDRRRDEMLTHYRFENIEVYCEREEHGRLRPSGTGKQLRNILNPIPNWMHGQNKNIFGKVNIEVTFYMYISADEDDLNPHQIRQAVFYNLCTTDTLHVLREKIEHSFLIPSDFFIGQFWKEERLFDDDMKLAETCIEINNHTVYSPPVLL
jgi:hypothetical protein